MAKFDYKKWVTENKYGKLNEQTELTTCYYCDPIVYAGSGQLTPIQGDFSSYSMFQYGSCGNVGSGGLNAMNLVGPIFQVDLNYSGNPGIGASSVYATTDPNLSWLNNLCQASASIYNDSTGSDVNDQTESTCKKIQACPACPSNNNYNPNYSYELGGNIAAECGTWSTIDCTTIDGNIPNPGDFFLVGSAQQVWMVYNVMDPTSTSASYQISTGCPELDSNFTAGLGAVTGSGAVTGPATGSLPGGLGIPAQKPMKFDKPKPALRKRPNIRRKPEKRKLQEVKKAIKKLIKEQIQLGNSPLHKRPPICKTKTWQGILALYGPESYCFGIADQPRCRGEENFTYMVPTEIDPSGRVGNEYCVCCEYEKIPDKKPKSGIQSPVPPEGGSTRGGSPTLTPMYTVIEKNIK